MPRAGLMIIMAERIQESDILVIPTLLKINEGHWDILTFHWIVYSVTYLNSYFVFCEYFLPQHNAAYFI